MNWLVYKKHASQDPDYGKKVSAIMYDRLKPDAEEKYSHLSERSEISNQNTGRLSATGGRMSYQEWMRAKDAERRLKKKLLHEAK